MSDLEIVIPAFKSEYLEILLDSLAGQSCSGFSVLVADDASPHNLSDICAAYEERLNLRYLRFEENVGGRDLVAHWNRAIRQSSGKWIHLPGDDDVLDPACVETFLRYIHKTEQDFDVYSLTVKVINGDGDCLREVRARDSANPADFLRQRFARVLVPAPVGYVFSRESFERSGGFVSFNRGWHSDDASFALFSARTGIKAIPSASVSWRVSDAGLSEERDAQVAASNLAATEQFLRWLRGSQSTLGMSAREIVEVTDGVAWQVYGGATDLGFGAWLSNSVRWSYRLGQQGSKAFPRHLWRFCSEREAPHNSVFRSLRRG